MSVAVSEVKLLITDGVTMPEPVAPVECDVVVVGTGAGGAPLGCYLAEKGYKVIFVEEGAYHPVTEHRELASVALSKLYRNSAVTPVWGNPTFAVLAGKGVGGTTTVNSGTCFRTPDEVLNHWINDFGLNEINHDEMRSCFEALEKDINVTKLKVNVMSRADTIVNAIFELEKIEGGPLDRNVINCTGCGMCCYGCTSGAKQSMDVNYIPRALKAGAKLFTSAKVVRIDRKGDAATGITASLLDASGKQTARKLTVRARATVVAGGALFSPIILKKSRMSRSPQLGKNLTVHPASKVYAEYKQEVLGWHGVPQAYYSRALESDGILLEGVFMPPDVVAPMCPLGVRETHDFMKSYRRMLTFGYMIKDTATGRVVDLPVLGPTVFYQLTQTDAERCKKATLFLARLFLKHGSKRVIPMIHSRMPELHSLADCDEYEKIHISPPQLDVAAFHPLSTCRMASNEKEGVVDGNAAVFGVERLYVSDGSIVPSSTGVNPQITIMAFSHRLARHLTTQFEKGKL